MTEQRQPIAYDGSKYRNGRTLVQNARRAIDTLPVTDEIKQEVLRVAGDIAKGTLEASEAINKPFYEEAEIYSATERGASVGHRGDLETDTGGLKELPGLFSTSGD